MGIENKHLDEVIQNLNNLEKDITGKFQQYETQLKETGSVSEALRADLNKMSSDHDAVVKQINGLVDELREVQQNGLKPGGTGDAPKSMGAQLVESDEFKAYAAGNSRHVKVNFQNNTIIGESGSPQTPDDTLVPKDYMSGIIPGAFRRLRVLDATLKGRTSSNTVHYTRELLWTNNAAETEEGGQKPESVLTFEGVNEPVRTIPHIIKVSKQVMDDAPMLQSYIDSRMRHGVLQRIDTQIVQGDGSGSNLSGITTTGNHTDLTIVTADTLLDKMNRAKEQVEVAEYEPTAYMVNPQDWGTIERLKTGLSGDNSYLAGKDGIISYVQNGMVPMVWGLPVIKTNAVPVGTFICLAMDSLMYVERAGVIVEMFEQDTDNVQKNLITVRAEARGALAIFRPASIVVGSFA